jgi:diguanylate cyclase (GGDEF)-like protein
MLTASGLQLLLVVLAPEVGVLSISVVFIVFAFSALRLTPRQLLPLWITISLGLALAIGLAGQAPALPVATRWQAALSALWLSLAIGRCAVVGLYGASVRQLLGTRNRELAQAQNQLHALATRDELTGALNRRAILGALDDALQAGARPSVALMDLDHFKLVNDSHGHLVGDTALRRFVLAAVRSLRADDRIGRYGGEEFLLLLATSEPATALAIAERVRRAVSGEAWGDVAAGLHITVSIGLATSHDGETAEQLLQRADEALYRAKAEGRDRVVSG